MRVGTICYATDQGLGVLAKSFYDAGVITDVMILRHSTYPNHPEWYPPGTHILTSRPFHGPNVDKFLDDVDVILFFETPFDWGFLDTCKQRGVRTVCMPMYEWFPRKPSHYFDKFICPSLLDVDYFPGSPFLVPPVDPSTWKLRTQAKRFLHNSGHIGFRNHKGTVELLKAIPMLCKDISLTIRSQRAGQFEKLLSEHSIKIRHPGVKVELGSVDREHLFDGYDVLVAPEKFNGLSLPLQEAFAAGMMVMGSDRYPMNTWLPEAALIPVDGYHRARVAGPYNEFDEAEIDPANVANQMNEWYDRDITEYSLMGKQWAEDHSWAAMKDKFLKELQDGLPVGPNKEFVLLCR